MWFRALLSALLIGISASQSLAENVISWTSGYPKVVKEGCKESIQVKGSFTLDTGWSPTGTVTVSVWRDGDEVFSTSVNLCGTSWSQIDIFVGSGTFNVVVEGEVSDGSSFQTLATKPGTVVLK